MTKGKKDEKQKAALKKTKPGNNIAIANHLIMMMHNLYVHFSRKIYLERNDGNMYNEADNNSKWLEEAEKMLPYL
jgi:hypothetical protein